MPFDAVMACYMHGISTSADDNGRRPHTRVLQQLSLSVLCALQVGHVQLVEQLRSQVDSLTQQLQHSQQHSQQHAQQHQLASQEQLCLQQSQRQQDHQQAHCLQELVAMQQLAALVLQQLQLYHSMQAAQQQQHAQAGACPAAASSEALQLQRGVQRHVCSHTAGTGVMQPSQPLDSTSKKSLLQVECHKLKQQLQQVSEAADVLVQQASAQGYAHLHSQEACATAAAADAADCGLDGLSLELRDPLDIEDSSSSGHSVGVSEAIQQLRQEMQAGLGVRSHHHHQQQQLGSLNVRLHNAMHPQHCSHSSRQQDQQQQQLQVVKLRLAYQQMLHKVQARYQRDQLQVEVKHQEVR